MNNKSIIKPILSLDFSIYGSDIINNSYLEEDPNVDLSELYSLPDKLIKGVTYHRINRYNEYVGLDNNDLCISSLRDLTGLDKNQYKIKYSDSKSAVSDVTVGSKYDGSLLAYDRGEDVELNEDKSRNKDPYTYYTRNSIYKEINVNPGSLFSIGLVKSGDGYDIKFNQLLTSNDSKLFDFIYKLPKMLSPKIADIIINYLGFNDLINSFQIKGKLLSFFIDSNDYYLVFGTAEPIVTTSETEVKVNAIVGSDWDYNQKVLGDKDNKLYITPKTIKLVDFDRISTSINELMELEERVGSLPDLPNLDQNSLEVTEYGDISDYISFKSLVEVNIVQKRKSGYAELKDYRITRDQVPARVFNNWDNDGEKPYDKVDETSGEMSKDPYLYHPNGLNYKDGNYISNPFYKYLISNKRLLNIGDLIELVISYRINKDLDSLNYSLFNSDNVDGYKGTIDKLYLTDSDGNKSPITFNGYHITHDTDTNYNKRIETVRLVISDDRYQLTDNFLIEFNSDSLSIYSRSRNIIEYYILSCKLINKSK